MASAARLITATLAVLVTAPAVPTQEPGEPAATAEANKELARGFYEDLWFSRNTQRYTDYVADTYVVHDIGDRKNVIEPAVEQKNTADLWWENTDMSGEIDFQIAEGDLVATRWRLRMEPTTLLGRILVGREELPIINVFRIEDGKIVEIWNHRHDIDTGMNVQFKAQGFGLGLLLALLPTFYALSLRKRLRSLEGERAQTPASERPPTS